VRVTDKAKEQLVQRGYDPALRGEAAQAGRFSAASSIRLRFASRGDFMEGDTIEVDVGTGDRLTFRTAPDRGAIRSDGHRQRRKKPPSRGPAAVCRRIGRRS